MRLGTLTERVMKKNRLQIIVSVAVVIVGVCPRYTSGTDRVLQLYGELLL